MPRHAQLDACPRVPLESGRHVAAATLTALGVLMLSAAAPRTAHGDWSAGAEASLRHDNNVGNARNSVDIVEDTSVGGRLSLSQLLQIAQSYSLIVGGDLSGESLDRLTGLNYASLDAAVALKKKWGLGAFAPWARAGLSVARADYDDGYRNAWIYRATLASGQRIDERWNVWWDYAFERRAATTQTEQPLPDLSSDAYSQSSNTMGFNMEFSLRENAFLTVGLLARHGDVVSTTRSGAEIYLASRALAEDPTFGPNAYAYKLSGTSYGLRAGVDYSPTAHSLLGCAFQRIVTRAEGGNHYTKSMPSITWNYRF